MDQLGDDGATSNNLLRIGLRPNTDRVPERLLNTCTFSNNTISNSVLLRACSRLNPWSSRNLNSPNATTPMTIVDNDHSFEHDTVENRLFGRPWRLAEFTALTRFKRERDILDTVGYQVQPQQSYCQQR